jgi:hypothetical protein
MKDQFIQHLDLAKSYGLSDSISNAVPSEPPTPIKIVQTDKPMKKFKVKDRVKCISPVNPFYGVTGTILEVTTNNYLIEFDEPRSEGHKACGAKAKCGYYVAEQDLELSLEPLKTQNNDLIKPKS